MSLFTGQFPVTTTSGTAVLCQLPPGPASVRISNGGTAVIYVGIGATVSTASGMPLPSGGVLPVELFAGGGPGTVRAVTSAGSATAGFMISTSYGLGPNPGVQ